MASPGGKTKAGKDASGAIVIIHFTEAGKTNMLMGQETKFLTDNSDAKTDYKKKFNKTLYEVFTTKGDASNQADMLKALSIFSAEAQKIENTFRLKYGHITFADVKNSSKSTATDKYISAKPRYVRFEDASKYGFTKGSYKRIDISVEGTAVREVKEETDVDIDISRLIDTGKLLFSDKERKVPYALFYYELTPQELASIRLNKVIEKKNADRQNELHQVQFREAPVAFSNVISQKAYDAFKSRATPGGARSAPSLTKKKSPKSKAITVKAKSVIRRTCKSPKEIPASMLYLENQSSLLCGQHSLNHILQEKKFITVASRSHAYKQPNGQINLLSYCRATCSAAVKTLGSAAKETIDCPKEGNYQADILIKAVKEELKYDVAELPFEEKGLAELKTKLGGARPHLLGLLINLGDFHWVSVASNIQAPKHLYIDSLDIQKSYKPMTDKQLMAHLETINPYRIYMISVPKTGAYYRCRSCM